ncbi:MAG TPA: hypothetical protein VFT12_05220 [Thermoanaerobaculia bacterium]|nr:hypothetical protein [Thermoanaerobaculia bacterium]
MLVTIALFTLAVSLPPEDAARLQCAHAVFQAVGEKVWPGWGAAPFDTLLIAGDHEFAISSKDTVAGFTPAAGEVPGYHVLSRPRTFDPRMLATFPLLAPPAPSIVVGTPAATGKSEAAWIVTVLHEHFHQHQYSQPWYYEKTAALGLARGDTTGMWMLNYEFPYTDPAVQQRYEAFTQALSRALRLRQQAGFAAALREVKSRWRELRDQLAPDDYAYLRFQAWQEGVARYVELRIAEAAAAVPCLKDSPAAATMDGIVVSLDKPDLGRSKRVAFYAAGAAIAMLLDETSPGWKAKYVERPFELETYFAP